MTHVVSSASTPREARLGLLVRVLTASAVAAAAVAVSILLKTYETRGTGGSVHPEASPLSVAGSTGRSQTPRAAGGSAKVGPASDVWIDLPGGSRTAAGRRVRMMPGDVASTPRNQPVVLTLRGGGKAWITLTEPTAQSRTCRACRSGVGGAGDLAQRLRLTMRDVTLAGAAATVYDGPLAPVAGHLAVRLPGSAPSGSWSSGESHSYQLSVAMPLVLGNGYQGTSAHVAFVYQETAVLGDRQSSLTPGLPFTGADIAALTMLAVAAIAGGIAITAGARALRTPPALKAGPGRERL